MRAQSESPHRLREHRPRAPAERLREAAGMLRQARGRFEKDGWTVETIRITTQPFPEYLRGLTREQGLEFLMGLDATAEKEGFRLAIGPAMSRDGDDPATMELLGELLSKAKRINATALVAGEDGIHWKVVRATARMIKYIEDHSPRSQGNFSFAAAAMMPGYAPFYPASYHTGAGRGSASAWKPRTWWTRPSPRPRGDPAPRAAA